MIRKEDLKKMFNRHCRVKLRSGKEVYGALWDEPQNQSSPTVYFASFGEFLKYRHIRYQAGIKIGQMLSLDEILQVEPIVH